MQSLLTQLLEMVRSGNLDSRHCADILKLVKREMFGDYTFQLAGQFIASGSLEQLTAAEATEHSNVSHELLTTNLQLVKALLSNFLCQQRAFFGSMGAQALK